MEKISLIVPCYNEEESLEILWNAIKETMNELPDYEYELLLIDDGSTDKTVEKMRELSSIDGRIRYISFSRNFGKEAAMYAGLCNAEGNYVAVMDADMQDPPQLLPKMLEILGNEAYDCVATRRVSRDGEPVIRSLFARGFYWMINKISDTEIMDGARDFRLMKKDMADAIIKMSERNRFSKGIFGWVGFRTYWYAYNNVERSAGVTKWNFWSLFKYSIDGIVNFSQMPLQIAMGAGWFSTCLAFVWMIYFFIKKLLFGNRVDGWTSLACMILFLGGVQLLSLGIIGQYISRMYMEVKGRPHYIVKETNDESVEKIG